jgi:O-antigen/teichoic acid export membrane protein
MTPIHRSIFFSALERYGSLVLLFVSTAVLSRLLAPAEFGVYAVVNAIVAVTIAPFQEFGGANYIIQKRSLSRRDIRTAFTITFCLSVLIGTAIFAGRDVFVWFFKQDDLRAAIAVSTLSLALTPFSATISALFRRDLEFGKLASCNLAANLATVAVSTTLAVLHFSFMAPIWGAVVGNAVLVAMLATAYGDIRIFRLSLWGYTDVLRFGFYSASVTVINAFYNLAPQSVFTAVRSALRRFSISWSARR